MARRTQKDAGAVENTENQVEDTAQAQEKPEDRKKAVYSVNELAANARGIFGTRQECVVAALKASGKMECTVTEAKEIVEKFLKKEVK